MIVDLPQLFGPTRMFTRWREIEKERKALYLSNLTEEMLTSLGFGTAKSAPRRCGVVNSSSRQCIELLGKIPGRCLTISCVFRLLGILILLAVLLAVMAVGGVCRSRTLKLSSMETQ